MKWFMMLFVYLRPSMLYIQKVLKNFYDELSHHDHQQDCQDDQDNQDNHHWDDQNNEKYQPSIK